MATIIKMRCWNCKYMYETLQQPAGHKYHCPECKRETSGIEGTVAYQNWEWIQEQAQQEPPSAAKENQE